MDLFCRPLRADVVPVERLRRRQEVAAVGRRQEVADEHLADGAVGACRRRLDVRETTAGRRQSQIVVRAKVCREELQSQRGRSGILSS